MYEYIRGEFCGLVEGRAIVEAGGIGWSLALTPESIAGLPSPGSEVLLYLVHIQREDSQDFYGFISRSERTVFRRLMTVSGVGPKQALRFLSGLATESLARAIREGDIRLLSSLPGLGKKTAEKLVFELQGKLDDLVLGEAGVGEGEAYPEGGLMTDAQAALLSLGYSPLAARAALNAASRELEESPSLQDLITRALRHV